MREKKGKLKKNDSKKRDGEKIELLNMEQNFLGLRPSWLLEKLVQGKAQQPQAATGPLQGPREALPMARS